MRTASQSSGMSRARRRSAAAAWRFDVAGRWWALDQQGTLAERSVGLGLIGCFRGLSAAAGLLISSSGI
jgi:hypothetical protein